MATSTLADVALTGAWVDLVVTHATLASADAVLQNAGNEPIAIVWGGADPSALSKSGIVLGPREMLSGNAAAVWARSLGTAGKVAVLLGSEVTASGAMIGTIADNAPNTAANKPVPVAAEVASAPRTYSVGDIGVLQMDTRGRLSVTIGAPDSGASLADANGVYAVSKGATSGGLSPARVLTGTTGVLKASAGQLYSLLSVRNANAAVRYLHLYDKATAPTLSTDTPVLTIALAASSVQNEINLTSIGAAFANGIAWAYTTDNIAIPTTAGTSTELMFSAVYK